MNSTRYLNSIIKFSFYSLFFIVPLFFLGNTSELFELNKMWITWILAIIISASWISKMIIERKIIIRKTPLDLPIILFLISQIISTIFSLDNHVSFWGYYSRFNGGLLSTITYITLYYAFASNLEIKHVLKLLFTSILAGVISALWGFPSHFDHDPTCFVFRGTFDTSCWTEAFKPTVRVFSTLGQPAWFAAYLDILLPISMAYALINGELKNKKTFAAYFVISLLFYISLIFANTRAGTAAFFAIDIIFWSILFIKKIFNVRTLGKYLLIFHLGFALCNFFYGAPIDSLKKFTLQAIKENSIAHAQTKTSSFLNKPVTKSTGITDSAEIRLLVWKGAIEAWKANPIIGTGVETFAYAYYKYRPEKHNLTSEWDYLYNKAHNEFLNYLTTTGLFGLGTYLSIIILYIFISIKYIFTYNIKSNHENGFSTTKQRLLLVTSLLMGYISILITNFFGFSVVIVNLYFFLIPCFFFIITGLIDQNNNYSIIFSTSSKEKSSINNTQWIFIIMVTIFSTYTLLNLVRYWYADTAYALGSNLDKISQYQDAFPYLENAVSIEPNEPVYKDELAVNLATLSEAYFLQKDVTTGNKLANEAINLDNEVVTKHPNNIFFWKNRLRIFYNLANGDQQNQSKYLIEALNAINKSSELAPTDAKTWYNKGLMVGQIVDLQKGADILEKTIKLKPDYLDAYSVLGIFYHQLALGQKTGTASPAGEKIINPDMQKKAIAVYQYLITNFSPNDNETKKTIMKWTNEMKQ